MLSEKLTEEVMNELHGRKGVGDELDRLRNESEDIYSELKSALQNRIGTTIARHNQEQQNTPPPLSPSDAPAPGGLTNA